MGVAPDAEIDGKGLILISSEEGETEENMDKPLSAFGLGDGGVLSCDDFLQNYTLRAYLWQMMEKPEDGSDFIVTGDKDKLQPKEAEEEKTEVNHRRRSRRLTVTRSSFVMKSLLPQQMT